MFHAKLFHVEQFENAYFGLVAAGKALQLKGLREVRGYGAEFALIVLAGG